MRTGVLVLGVSVLTPRLFAQTFYELPANAWVNALSGDGSTVLMTTVENQQIHDAVRWRPGQPVEIVPFGTPVYGVGLSTDGTIVHANAITPVSGRYPALRWNNQVGAVQTLPFTLYNYSAEYPMSGDCEWMAVGNQRWNIDGSMTSIPNTIAFPAYGNGSVTFVPGPGAVGAFSISDDGQRVGGAAYYMTNWYNSYGESGQGGISTTGVVWSPSTGTLRGDQIVAGLNLNFVQDISDDGTFGVVLLQQGLATLDFAAHSYSVIPSSVGGSNPVIAGNGAAILAGSHYWSPSTGMVTIPSLLNAAGCNTTGWSYLGGYYVSDDGRVLVGMGQNAQNESRWWYATIPSAPVLSVPMMAVLLGSRRRKRRCGSSCG